MSLKELRAPAKSTHPMLIFVHGILSDSQACWRNSNGVSWPEIVMRDPDFPPCGVSTFSYSSRLFGSRFSIADAANSLWELMKGRQMIASGRTTVFVCHSMGGIVVRKLLVKRQVDLAGNGFVGLFLVASPTMGSQWAAWLLPVTIFFRHTQAIALSSKESNRWLQDLKDEFINLRDNGPVRIFGRELLEAEPIAFRWVPWIPPIVRSIEGGVLFAESLKIGDSNHFTVAKPVHEGALQHVALRNFINDLRKRSSGGNYKFPEGTSFEQAARMIARSRGLDIELGVFTDRERNVISTLERLVTGTTAEDALINLISAFPAGAIRKYGVRLDQSTAILTMGEVP